MVTMSESNAKEIEGLKAELKVLAERVKENNTHDELIKIQMAVSDISREFPKFISVVQELDRHIRGNENKQGIDSRLFVLESAFRKETASIAKLWKKHDEMMDDRQKFLWGLVLLGAGFLLNIILTVFKLMGSA